MDTYEIKVLRTTSCGSGIRPLNKTPLPYIESNSNWFFFVKSGELLYADGENNEILTAGNFYILPARKPFTLTDILNSTFDHAYISFDLNHPITSFFTLSLKDRPFLKDIFDVLIKHYKSLNEKTLSSIVNSILCYTFNKTTPSSVLADSIKSYIDEKAPKISINDLCDFFHYEKHSLNKKFKSNFGITITQYIKNKQFSYVAEQLKNGIPLCELANTIGYSSPANLSRDFRKHFGVTSSNYKKSRTIYC